MTMNGDTATILGSVLFVLVLALAVMVSVLAQRAIDNREARHRAIKEDRRKAALRRKKEQEAADSDLLDKVEGYRHDFDGHSG